jgi:hypothetical protein
VTLAIFRRPTMTVEDNPCSNCSGGCTAGKTEAAEAEEISSGVYLLLGGIIIVAVSLLAGWLFRWLG